MFLPGQRAALFFLFFLFSLPGLTQFHYREIKHHKDKNLVFPVFTNANKAVAKHINEFLQMDFFGTTIYRIGEHKLFDDSRYIWEDSIVQGGYTSISYNIELNNSKILSVVFQVEGMAAYPTYFKRYFSFDAKTGKPISADTLFTNQGLKRIKEILIKKRNVEIETRIEELSRDSLVDYPEDSSFIAEKFSECNAEAEENKMFITKDQVRFYKQDCFPHAWGPYETNLDIVFAHKELEKYFSELGKKLLFTK